MTTPTGDSRPATVYDLNELERGLRREMKLWLGLGVGAGQVFASAVAYFAPQVPHTVGQALIGVLLWPF